MRMRSRYSTPRQPPPPDGWSGPRPFIGRESLLRELDRALEEAISGHGQFVILHGPDGSGRAAIGHHFIKRARRKSRRLRSAAGDAADPDNPAFRQLAARLTTAGRAGRALRRSLKDWIGALVPVIGDALEALIETIQTLRRTQDSAHAPTGSGSTIDQVRLLLTFGGEDPRIILLENLEGSDADELAGAFALVQRLQHTHTLFIGTCLSASGQLPGRVRDLLREAERLGVGRLLQVPNFTPQEAADAAELAINLPLPTAWRAWLDACAPRTPADLWELLGGLERQRLLTPAGRRWQLAPQPPPPAHASGRMTLADVSPDERALLAAAGAQGLEFRVPRLVQQLGWDELRVQDQLASLSRRNIVRFRETAEEDGELIDVYTFDSPATAAAWTASGATPKS